MNRNFSQMKSDVGNNVQDTSSSMAVLIGRYINNAYFDVLRRFNWDFHNHDYQLTLVAGTRDYTLPRDFGKEIYVYDSTNNLKIPFKSFQQTQQDFSGSLNDSGDTSFYCILDKRYNNNPSSASSIIAVSDNSDDSTQTVTIRGIDQDGVERVDNISLLGQTPANGSVSFASIISIGKSDNTTGVITLTSNGGTVTVAVLAPEETVCRRKCIRFFQNPTSEAVIQVPYKISPLPLYHASDAPLIDSDIIEHGATMLTWRYKRQFVKAQEWERTFEKLIVNRIWDQENQINRVQQLSVEAAPRDIY